MKSLYYQIHKEIVMTALILQRSQHLVATIASVNFNEWSINKSSHILTISGVWYE